MPNVEDIRYLLKGGQSRETNDEENKIREDILTNILYIDNDEYLNNPEFGIHWKKIKEKFNEVLNTLCKNETF